MMRLDDSVLKELLRGGESDRVEFKETFKGSAPMTIREAICAFANDLSGHGEPGVVFIGVRDNGEIIGIQITDELLVNLAEMKTDGNIVPLPTMTVEQRTFDGQDVAVVTVQPSDSPPVRYRGKIWVRTGPRRGFASSQDERILNEKRRFGDSPFDIQPIPSTTMFDLNERQFKYEYLPNAVSPEILASNAPTRPEQLASTKMIASVADPKPTVLGLLVLGNSPIDVLPGAFVQFLKINGKELTDNVVDAVEIHGTLSEVLRRLDEKLQAHNYVAVDFTSGLIEQRKELYPFVALQQITRNALLHRTYENTYAPVRVSWFHDRLEILSPGGPFGLVTSDNFGQPGITDYRNPNLAEALKGIGFRAALRSRNTTGQQGTMQC